MTKFTYTIEIESDKETDEVSNLLDAALKSRFDEYNYDLAEEEDLDEDKD